MLLAVALVYTSFSASSQAKQPSELLHASPGSTYEMTGEVVPGSIHATASCCASGSPTATAPRPRSRSATRGKVPDPFRGGREMVLTGKVEDGTFVGERDTLITKCPSKFADRGPAGSPSTCDPVRTGW